MGRLPVLVLGFDPFLEFDENPSDLVARRLNGKTVSGHRITGKTLPVNYSSIEREIVSAIDSTKPDLVLGFGLAAGRDKITPEKVAVNYINSKVKDNSARKLEAVPIDRSQPDGIFTSLPVEALVKALNRSGIPASLSLSAGAYLCNNTMFLTLREARKRGFAAGFIHVPIHAEWVEKRRKSIPSLPLSTIERAGVFSLEFFLRRLALAKRAKSGRERHSHQP
jgi:pyroglutamyl-peptidase